MFQSEYFPCYKVNKLANCRINHVLFAFMNLLVYKQVSIDECLIFKCAVCGFVQERSCVLVYAKM